MVVLEQDQEEAEEEEEDWQEKDEEEEQEMEGEEEEEHWSHRELNLSCSLSSFACLRHSRASVARHGTGCLRGSSSSLLNQSTKVIPISFVIRYPTLFWTLA